MMNLKPADICRICAGAIWPIYTNTKAGVHILMCEDCKTIVEGEEYGVSLL